MLVFICVLLVRISEVSSVTMDMTHPFDAGSLYWPSGQSPFVLTVLDNGTTSNGYWYQSGEYRSGIHMGTHLDAPCHFYKGGWSAEQIPINRLITIPAVMIDIHQSSALSADINITLDDIREFEKKNGEVTRGAVVVQCSGWSDKYPNRAEVFGNDVSDTSDFHFPGYSLETVEFLVEKRGIVGIAVDTPSVDYAQSKTFPVHVFIGRNNIYGLENVKDTCSLPPTGATLTISPMPIKGASGAPTRIYATWGGEHTSGSYSAKMSAVWNTVMMCITVGYMCGIPL